jgi:coenzyme F420-reducing hydrogenase delta subunit
VNGTTFNFQPRLMGFLCEKGTYIFCNFANPVCRKIPANFIGLPIASVNQVQTNELLRAFLSGADGVLIAGCEACRDQSGQQQYEVRFSEIKHVLDNCGIDSERLRLEWISAEEEEKFLRVIHEMIERLRNKPALRLVAGLGQKVPYCG